MTYREISYALNIHTNISRKIYAEANRFETDCINCFLEFFEKFKDLMKEYPENIQKQMWDYYLNDMTINGEELSIFAKAMIKAHEKEVV